jgi:hypothetical protein
MLRWAAFVAIAACGGLVMWALGVHRLQHQIFVWIAFLALARLTGPTWTKAAQRFANRFAKPS